MNKADRFYDQADEAYRVGSLRLYSKSFAEAPFTVLFGLLFIVLPTYLIEKFCANKRKREEDMAAGQAETRDPMDDIREWMHEKVSRTEQKAEIDRMLKEHEEIIKTDDEWGHFAPGVTSFEFLKTVKEIDTVQRIMQKPELDNVRGVLRWLLSLPTAERKQRLDELVAWKCQISSLANYLERGELEAYLKKSRELSAGR